MSRRKTNIWLKYALLHDKHAKDISIDCKISMKTAYSILRGGTLNKLEIAQELVKYLQIPYKEFERWWRK